MLNVLLTNDDGIDSPGLQALHRSVTQAIETHLQGREYKIITVAPDRCRSESRPAAGQLGRDGAVHLAHRASDAAQGPARVLGL